MSQTTAFGLPQVGSSSEDQVRAFLKSGVVPGWQQWSYGQGRAWAFLALEAAGWWAYLHQSRTGGDRRVAYRDYAWERARVQALPRRDGDFDYYERLANYARSGAFDAEAASGLQPEADPATYNGRIWDLALGLFLGGSPPVPGSPGYEQALGYYRERAYGEAFLWDWTSDPAGRDTYRALIEESDAAFRNARAAVGALIANHVFAGVDAYLSARSGHALPRAALVPTAGPTARAGRVSLRLQWGLP